ncbi:proline racemase family protein [Arthrobacter alpinus]|nr:proline racemase family protein [Arthrobacter alpinus]
MALLSDQGDLAEGEILENYSIIDSRFAARVVDRAGGPEGGLVVEVSGRSFPVGQGKFTLDADDELGVGFVLR